MKSKNALSIFCSMLIIVNCYGQLFPPPNHASTGDEAYNIIVKYFADSRFTNCPAGWPNCQVEERYSHFANGKQAYCRLTSVSGADILAYGDIMKIIGADLFADGSWAVKYSLYSYETVVYYTWIVSANGNVNGYYWRPGLNPETDLPSQEITGLHWVRGALDCSY